MLTVSVAVNGETVATVSAVNAGWTTPEEGKDPDGERRYQIRRWDPFSFTSVTHRRSDGALVLAATALAAITEETSDAD